MMAMMTMMIIIIIMGLDYKRSTVWEISGKVEGEGTGYWEVKRSKACYIYI
jgi:hypothetical protein